MKADLSVTGALPNTPDGGTGRTVIPTHRAWVNFGLRYRRLGTQTIQVTGGDSADDTFRIYEGTTELTSSAVPWNTSHNQTAADIATNINANWANHNWVATVATDTVTIRQRSGGAAGTITATVANDATVTIANSGNVTGDTATWTELISGATMDGDQYYELGWAGTLLEGSIDIARLTHVTFYCDGQAFQLWSGGLRTASNAIVQGIPVASATWAHNTLGGWLPWLDAAQTLVIKLAADEELLYMALYV